VEIRLRPAVASDAEFVFALVSGEETRPFLGRIPESGGDLEAELEQGGWLVFEVDGEPGGCCAYTVVSERNGIVEVGRFAVHPRLRGRRVGVEAAKLVQRHLLVDRGFHRIELRIYGFNERAIAHAELCGYVREGVKRKAYLRNGEWQDAVLFALVQEDLA
jgi:RimJ/RimL family protein N-acetyltransferase